MNYFSLFHIDNSFDVDINVITARYHELQKQCHPDRHTNANPQEKLAIVQKAAQINDAFYTLKKPIARAEYMLALRGIDLQHETKTLQDPVFLMQQMEYRERIDDIKTADNALDLIVEFETELQQEIKQMQSQLGGYLIELTDDGNQAAANLIRKLKFMHKLEQELSRLEDELVDF